MSLSKTALNAAKKYLQEIGLPLGTAFVVMVASPLRLSSTWVEEAGKQRKSGPPELDEQGRQLYELDVFRLKKNPWQTYGAIETVLVAAVPPTVEVGDFVTFTGLSSDPSARSWNMRAEAAVFFADDDVIDLEGE